MRSRASPKLPLDHLTDKLMRAAEKQTAGRAAECASALFLEGLELRNVWCYGEDQEPIALGRGVTVVSGANGSGKSSLLESIFFALYGSTARVVFARDLDQILRQGAHDGRVELRFSLDGQPYSVAMALHRRGDRVVSDRDDCQLTGASDKPWVGVKEVAEQIERLLGLSGEDFANCVYVRQGEIDRLIAARPAERQQMIDRLLQLAQLDNYVLRAREGARRAVSASLRAVEAGLRDRNQQLAELAELHLAEKLNSLERELAEAQTALSTVDEQRAQLDHLRTHLDAQLHLWDQIALEVQRLQRESENKSRRLSELDEAERRLSVELRECQQGYLALEKALLKAATDLGLDGAKLAGGLRASDASEAEQVADMGQELDRCRQAIVDSRAALAGFQERARVTEDERSAQRQEFVRAGAQTAARLQALEREAQQSETLIAAGRCPVCKQTVSAKSPATQRLAELAQEREELQRQRQKWEAELRALEQQISAQRRARQMEMSQLQAALEATESRQQRLFALRELAQKMLHLKIQGCERREQRDTIVRAQDDVRADRLRLMEQLSEKKPQLGDREELQQKRAWAEREAATRLAEQRALQSRIAELHRQCGATREQLSQQARLQQELAQGTARQAHLRRTEAQLEELIQLYDEVKRTLRQRSLAALNQALSHFFSVMGTDQNYESVMLTEQYEIWVEHRDGQRLSPMLLSGGERAQINIALRAAIHQVLSSHLRRMPLILDEPTIYLDRDRVDALRRLLEHLGQRVGQVIVVSHEPGLVERADHEYLAEKGSDNVSRLRKIR